MKIEKDRAEVTSGIRHGRTLGSPVALRIDNRDYANWEERMNPWPVEAEVDEVHLPRPGHADLAGVQKYGFTDVRNVLERASARETAARVAAGALAKAFLARARGHGAEPRDAGSDRCVAPEPAELSPGQTSRAWTSRPCAASTPRRARRWWPRSTRRARPTSRSAECSRCARSGSCPASARTSRGRSASTAGWRRRSCRSRR